MKTTLALFATLLSLSAAQAETFSYLCKCIDTGLECEGGEYMYVDINSKTLKWAMAYKPGDLYKGDTGAADRDPEYNPRTNKDYYKYDSRKTEPYPYLLAKQGMLRGTRTGYVKKPEIQGCSYGHQWEYECSRE